MALKIKKSISQSPHQDSPWDTNLSPVGLGLSIPEQIMDKGVSCHE